MTAATAITETAPANATFEVFDTCCYCFRPRRLTAEGLLADHRYWAAGWTGAAGYSMTHCPGSGLSPAE